MNNKIKAAAEERYPLTGGIIEEHIAKYKRMAFTSGAEYFRKESGIDELAAALEYALGEISWFAEKYPATASELQKRIKKPLVKYLSFNPPTSLPGE